MLNRRSLLLALALVAVAPIAPAPAADDVIAFAAASLKNALDEVVASYHQATGKTVNVSYAASSALAKQIEQAAPADIFFFADLTWMKYLHDKNLTVADTEKSLLGNEIVLVVPRDSAATATIAAGFDLSAILGADGKLAMANVESVPAGKYGKAALTKLGVWDSVSARVVQADNVRAALAFVARGEAPAGIVYATDAQAEPAVKIIGTFPADTHPPIVYPAALIAASANPNARAFLEYLASDAAKPAYVKQGFTIVEPAM